MSYFHKLLFCVVLIASFGSAQQPFSTMTFVDHDDTLIDLGSQAIPDGRTGEVCVYFPPPSGFGSKVALDFVWGYSEPGSTPTCFFSNRGLLPPIVFDPSNDVDKLGASLPYATFASDGRLFPCALALNSQLHLWLGTSDMTYDFGSPPTGHIEYFRGAFSVTFSQPTLVLTRNRDLAAGQTYTGVFMTPTAAAEDRVVFLTASSDDPVVEPVNASIFVPAGSRQVEFLVFARTPGEGHLLIDDKHTGDLIKGPEWRVTNSGKLTHSTTTGTTDTGGQWARRKCITTGGCPGDAPGHHPQDLIYCCAPSGPIANGLYSTPACCPTGSSIAFVKTDYCDKSQGALATRCCFANATVDAPNYEYTGIIIVGTGGTTTTVGGSASRRGVGVSVSRGSTTAHGQVCCTYKRSAGTTPSTYEKCTVVPWVYSCP
jgi:hypothetical protein